MKKGKSLETKLHKWLKELDIYHQRFFDSASQGLIGSARPADYWCWFKSKLIFIECKETHQKSLPFSNIATSQWKACKDAKKDNILYLFLIEIQKELYIVQGELMINWAKYSNKKSISYDTITKIGDIMADKSALRGFLTDI